MSIKANAHSPKVGPISGVQVWKMPSFPDVRGRLFKAYTAADTHVFPIPFNTFEHFFTESNLNVFRGMHFQGSPHAVSKIISIVQGKAVDFLFDMRENSETFENLQVIDLDEVDPVSIYIPTGVAHGYLALRDKTIISYRMDGPFCGNCDGGFSGEFIANLLPVPFFESIQSVRDLSLVAYKNFKYLSDCSG